MDILINTIRLCKANNQQAFNTLFKQYEGYLYKICYSYCQNKDIALDIMQEIYIKVFKSIKDFDENRQLLPWLKKITVNTCLNYQRDNAKHKQLSLDQDTDGDTALKEIIPADTNVEEDAINHINQELISYCIETLPQNYRMAITLKYLEDMSYEEISSYLAQPVGTVKSNIFRARNLLRTELQKFNLLEV